MLAQSQRIGDGKHWAGVDHNEVELALQAIKKSAHLSLRQSLDRIAVADAGGHHPKPGGRCGPYRLIALDLFAEHFAETRLNGQLELLVYRRLPQVAVNQ